MNEIGVGMMLIGAVILGYWRGAWNMKNRRYIHQKNMTQYWLDP